ncbi:MAG TPA: hypothetical protein VK961_08050 [Chthoniobacter sp.]|nr:hypothetical protein [Chthoniobacter sp.]
MKICPQCSFANDERYPTCVSCNAYIVDVPSTPSADPTHPEHEGRALTEQRHKDTRRQLRSATLFYALIITLIAWMPGLISSMPVLLLYFTTGIVVGMAVSRDIAGQFSASALQGAPSVTILFVCGLVQPFTFFMLLGHIILPAFLWHWMYLIQSANR